MKYNINDLVKFNINEQIKIGEIIDIRNDIYSIISPMSDRPYKNILECDIIERL